MQRIQIKVKAGWPEGKRTANYPPSHCHTTGLGQTANVYLPR